MNLISKIIISNDAASDLNTAINNAGASVVSLLGTCAAVISTLIASVGAIVLLVVCDGAHHRRYDGLYGHHRESGRMQPASAGEKNRA